MFNEGIIHDERTFVRNLLRNRFTTKAEVGELEEVLAQEYRDKKRAGEADNRTGDSLSKFLFFQGAIMGMLIAYKQMKLHLDNEAWKRGIDPSTGQEIPDHGNKPQ